MNEMSNEMLDNIYFQIYFDRKFNIGQMVKICRINKNYAMMRL